MLLYGLTIFLSAFLLFQVQPMIAKIILPWFGGSAAVWSTCMMYFQISLLLGYLYAHGLMRLDARRQAMVHIALLAVSLLLLPIHPSPAWKPGVDSDPLWRIVLLLGATIGLPYFLLSTTGPLLQAWYLRRSGAIPYRLFALSNFASLLALLTFPVAVEPFLTTRAQAIVWSAIYAGFATLCAVAAWVTMRAPALEQARINEDVVVPPPPSIKVELLWMALAACASALLLGLTNQLSYNVAPIPFLWVLPLTLYLLSFILCFESERVYVRGVFIALLPIALGWMAYLIYSGQGNPDVYTAVPVFSAGLFVCCMVCHGEVARMKPHPRHLTKFYLLIASGGAAGGLFVALIAPHVFRTYTELPVSMVACAVLIAVVLWNEASEFEGFSAFQFRYAAAIFTAGLIAYMGYNQYENDKLYRMSVRNFYGALRIRDQPETDTETALRMLVHGTIIHGEQLLDESMRDLPTSYYGLNSGVGVTIRTLQKERPVRVAIVGLGAGVIASYCRAGDFYRFYELNPLARDIASTWFTFVKDCKAEHDILMGDARLVLERQAPQNYDVLALDAFSSDAIPVHLLTREAFELYFRHLNPRGVLAVHVSNKYLDLAPVIAEDARALGKSAVVVHDDGADADYLFVTTWVLVSSDPSVFQDKMFAGAKPLAGRSGLRLWTDDYSNLIQILK